MSTDRSPQIQRVLSRRCAAQGIPVSGIFELTPRCNLRCKMCYIRLTPDQMAPIGRELTAEEWLQIAAAAKDAGLMFLLLTGGEPTLRSDFLQIYEALAQMGFSISINTNGTLLTPELRALWHRLPPAYVNITLYGTSREDYHALCGDPNAFDRVIDALNWLKQEQILTHLNTTMTPDNCTRWEELEEFVRSLDLELRMTTYCFPPVRRLECGECSEFTRVTPELAAELNVRDVLYREGIDAVKRRAADLSIPLQPSCDAEVGENIQCLAGRSQFWITWDGRMTPCGMLPVPCTRPLDQGFGTAWNALHEATKGIRLCPDCVSCEERKTCLNCAAVIYTETGSFTGKPEYMCNMNKAYREYVTKLANE